MQRFTIFTVFFFLIAAIVSVELAFSGRDRTEKTSAATVDISSPSSPHPLLAPEAAAVDFLLNQEVLVAVGFSNPSLEPLTPERMLFSLIPLPAAAPQTYNKFAVFEDARVRGVLYEVPFASVTDAAAVYHALKQAATALSNYSVNETNGFGDASFYVNHLPPLPRVLLISRINDRLFGFEYPPETHERIQALIAELTKKE